jgi:hypothetical protein
MKTKAKQKSSGGVIPNNYRQGSRAELIAQYFFSEFCIAERVLKENDFGIDLYCSLMNVSGAMGFTSTLFCVQIKSGNESFKYTGEYVSQWLKMINLPLLMCRVNQDKLSIEIFSTWPINSLLAAGNSFNEVIFVESYSSEEGAESLKMPEIIDGIATIWMGPPIIQCTLNDIINETISKKTVRDVLEEWVSFDYLNYAKRHVGITAFYGYIMWVTNESLNTSKRTWYRPHIFNNEHSKRAIHLILEAATLIALNQGKDNNFIKGIAELLKNNNFVNKAEMDSWQKEITGIK